MSEIIPRTTRGFIYFLVLAALIGTVSARPARAAQTDQPIPILAYYYIWFEGNSWNRAKTDYPLLGRYSSDDRAVMEQHVRWAKQAGIDGFIVSWKLTDVLEPRLALLADVAAELDFKLAVIYQGLDFERDPIPVEKVAADLEWFAEVYGDHPVFDLFGRPLVIWSGTWKFTLDQIAPVTAALRPGLLVLASERNLEGYLRVADHFDGNAYYWSSVNPDTFPGYPEKLAGLSEAVHARGGLWIAPAAPGFDARLIGGTTVVERRDGETLLIQLQAAFNSAPDAVGLISWNEFSENSHVEPSENHGTRYLEILADAGRIDLPVFENFNSSDPPEAPVVSSATPPSGGDLAVAVVAVAGFVLVGLILVGRLVRAKSK
ncbi:MAG TPA: hypothetical protein VMN57_09310 [Anaerolineales bacterium]|nr:hypothetical protein [Anaerolineales bacterium]